MKNRFNDSIPRAQRGRILTSALALSLGFGLFASGGSTVFGQQQPAPPETPTVSNQQQPSLEKVSETPKQQAPLASPAELSRVFIKVAKRIKPAVVQINFVSGAQQTSYSDESKNSKPSDSPSDQPAGQPL